MDQEGVMVVAGRLRTAGKLEAWCCRELAVMRTSRILSLVNLGSIARSGAGRGGLLFSVSGMMITLQLYQRSDIAPGISFDACQRPFDVDLSLVYPCNPERLATTSRTERTGEQSRPVLRLESVRGGSSWSGGRPGETVV
jgi:hypothetical protein